jgi:hypothetical protein
MGGQSAGGDSLQGGRSPEVGLIPTMSIAPANQLGKPSPSSRRTRAAFPLRQDRQVKPTFDEEFRDFAKIRFTTVNADVFGAGIMTFRVGLGERLPMAGWRPV